MKEVQTSGDYKIYEKRSGRYAVKGSDKNYVNGDEKAKILADVGLVTIPEPKAAPAEEAPPEETAEEATAEASDEATPAEEASADESSEDAASAEEAPADESSEESKED